MWYEKACTGSQKFAKGRRQTGHINCDGNAPFAGKLSGRPSSATGRHPAWDKELYERSLEMQEAEREADAERQRQEYDEYLLSDKWRAKADAVLARANYRCEGCGKRRATQVHHTTYQHIFDEFLFEVAAVCADCHRRIHKPREGGI